MDNKKVKTDQKKVEKTEPNEEMKKVETEKYIKEIEELKNLGFDILPRLYISNRAKLVSYLHPFLDQAEEFSRSKDGKKIGTTSRGIGPTYSDSRARRGLLMGDIMFPDFDKKLEDLCQMHLNLLKMYQKEYGFEIPEEKIKEITGLLSKQKNRLDKIKFIK